MTAGQFENSSIVEIPACTALPRLLPGDEHRDERPPPLRERGGGLLAAHDNLRAAPPRLLQHEGRRSSRRPRSVKVTDAQSYNRRPPFVSRVRLQASVCRYQLRTDFILRFFHKIFSAK